MNNSLLRKYVRLVLESLPDLTGANGPMAAAGMNGNSIQSPDDVQYTYQDTENIDIEIYPVQDGKTQVQIVSLVDDNLSSPVRMFANEEEAQNFARAYVEKRQRIMMAKENR